MRGSMRTKPLSGPVICRVMLPGTLTSPGSMSPRALMAGGVSFFRVTI
jgi:hypothetical protein